MTIASVDLRYYTHKKKSTLSHQTTEVQRDEKRQKIDQPTDRPTGTVILQMYNDPASR